MDESVALDSSRQKHFVKSVRSIKKRLKKTQRKSPKDIAVIDEDVVVNKENNEVGKKKKTERRNKKGLVYLSHIPHGFYEEQMTEYFKQFGVVTNARVIRSRRTGNSKGFAFVEFREPEVAEIVAETMNNYLMGKRIIKAAYIPPHKQRLNALRKNWNYQNNPASNERLNLRKKHNEVKDEKEELKIARKLLLTLSKTKEKLSALGIEYDFFKPVDVPESLVDEVDKLNTKTDVKSNKQVKNESKELKPDVTSKTIKTELEDVNVLENTDKKKKKQLKKKKAEKTEKSISNLISTKTATSIKRKLKNESKEENKISSTEEKIKIKQKKQQKAGKIEKEENFITIKQSSDSESSFDSDEFEKTLEMDSSDLTSGDESDVSQDEEILESPKKQQKRTPKVAKKQGKANPDLRAPKKQDKGNVTTQSVVKRKTTQSAPLASKKAKFEKQLGNRQLNKVIKKRK
ncbi:MKI67 FHA domain-interacting nucleolar phosphoprotein-like [Bicyclus anynana]|uniref:MKI67 FHA domain-interacting nucleolar phosphoprotein-like n=1 Tax=Bicyclus anynana TaxID=110368 RepID=A0A6J1MYW8_BICAN|nr:MKI67 FHA domain-interacting nucleolar phosphoprotein-like [Bicyclus anynana]XP_052740646.1 MKI67 FHA domain-interacting nucleolar phosphoprotein-like [Bicyclus anynana]